MAYVGAALKMWHLALVILLTGAFAGALGTRARAETGTFPADDRWLCMVGADSVDEKIAACSRLSGKEGLASSFRAMVHANRAYAYSLKDDLPAAVRDYSIALVLEPKNRLVLFLRGEAHLISGNYRAAIADYDTLLALDPAFPYARYNRGRANEGLGNKLDALDDYRLALKRMPEDAGAHVGIGVIEYGYGSYGKALTAFTTALRHDPKSADAAYNRAVTHERMNNVPAAIADYTLALAIDPERGEAAFWRGMLHDGEGDHRAALNDITYALLHHPADEAEYRNASCWIRASNNLGLESALSECERALALQPENFNFRANRVFTWLRMGHFEAVRDEADALLKISPDAAEIIYMRGLARIRLGDMTGGEQDVNDALWRAPSLEARYREYGLTP